MSSAFNIAHDCGSSGYVGRATRLFDIADSNCAITTSVGNFVPSGNTAMNIYFCTAYNSIASPSSGVHITDSASNSIAGLLGSILANNQAFGITRAAITAALPITFESFNDFFANGTAPRNNAEDTTAYDTTPTDLAVDPGFVDAPNQDFRIGPNIRRKAKQVFQVGGTSQLDMGAVQSLISAHPFGAVAS